MNDPRQLAHICVCGSVQFGSGRNKFMQLLIWSRNCSGRFVRPLKCGKPFKGCKQSAHKYYGLVGLGLVLGLLCQLWLV